MSDAGERSAPTVRESVLSQLGGITGLVESSIPVAVFVVVNILAGLRPGLIAAIGSAVAIAAVRLVRREAVRHALNGLVGVVLAALVAGWTGRAADFYLPGILAGLGYGAAFTVSVLVRWPLVGVIWSFLDGSDAARWRTDRRQLRCYAGLSLLWAAVFFARAGVQGSLYLADRENWLGVARLVMGLPLFAAALAVTIWQVRALRRS